jgi:Asp-tRNA(Asn)/Glu-tRNA(Gln) amidotransferase A subunit family amidase
MVSELAASVRAGDVSPADLVEESLLRIAAFHDDLNAVIRIEADWPGAAAGPPPDGAADMATDSSEDWRH